MRGAHQCPYTDRAGVKCGKSCMHPEGCYRHRAPTYARGTCSVCQKRISSKTGYCKDHGVVARARASREGKKRRALEDAERRAAEAYRVEVERMEAEARKKAEAERAEAERQAEQMQRWLETCTFEEILAVFNSQ